MVILFRNGKDKFAGGGGGGGGLESKFSVHLWSEASA